MSFLKDFTKRMECVGRFSLLMQNSFEKTTWNNFGIDVKNKDLQMNIIYSVLLFIMESSLREDVCTIDDIAGFLYDINVEYYHFEFGYDESKELARFIVDTILGNSGNAQYFTVFNYQSGSYENINVRYIDNKAAYLDNGVKRISYSLTDEGYNMLLSTLELENNLKFTIQEMIFKLHLEKADYGSAVNDIKNIFDRLTVQCRKIQNEMLQIKRNALAYSVDDYGKLVGENMDTVRQTREKFNAHRDFVTEKIREFEKQKMNDVELNAKEEDNLDNLRIIGRFLSKVIDEHQKILSLHFDLKKLYGYELENYSNMTMVQRFDFRSDLYDKLLSDASLLKNVDEILNPLFFQIPGKIYNPNLALEYQTKIRKKRADENDIELGFDAEELIREREEKIKQKRKMYRNCVEAILEILYQNENIYLSDIESKMDEELKLRMIPTPEIFREVMIEFLGAGRIDMERIKRERADRVLAVDDAFVLNEYIMDIAAEKQYDKISEIRVSPVTDGSTVVFTDVVSQNGKKCNLRCSDVYFELLKL
jgi:hypothetical protein